MGYLIKTIGRDHGANLHRFKQDLVTGVAVAQIGICGERRDVFRFTHKRRGPLRGVRRRQYRPHDCEADCRDRTTAAVE